MLANIAGAKVLFFVLALAVALAVASATENRDLYWAGLAGLGWLRNVSPSTFKG